MRVLGGTRLMKNSSKGTRGRRITRREFVGGAVAAAGVVTGAPAILRGQKATNRLRIAFIACGGRARASLSELTIRPGAPPPAGRGTPDPFAGPHPNEDVTVLCDIDDNAIESAAEFFPKTRRENDLRKVFDHTTDCDAVVAATNEHTHPLATYLQLIHGKLVHCEQPLTSHLW